LIEAIWTRTLPQEKVAHPSALVASLVVGILIAVLIAAGAFILLASQQ
jgi:flagellar biosynthesis protein FliQ